MMNNYIKQLKEKSSERNFLKKELKSWKKKKSKNQTKHKHLEVAHSIIQKAAQTTQSYLSIQLSDIVTKALKSVFQDDAYTFKINFVQRRNSTECDLLFAKGDSEFKPLDSCGYGAADIASFALRIAYWKLDGSARNILILDEPFRNSSLNLHPIISQMVQQLSQQLDLQFLIVTHSKRLTASADRIFRVTKLMDSKIKRITI